MSDEQNDDNSPKGIGKVNATQKATGEKVSIEYDFKGSVDEAVEAFGEEAVHFYYFIGARTALRNKAYAMAQETDDQGNPKYTIAQIEAELASWKPEATKQTSRKSALEKALGAIGSMSAEDRAKLLAALAG